MLLQKRYEIHQSFGTCEHQQRYAEGFGTLEDRGHQGPCKPIASGSDRRTQPHAVETVFCRPATEMVWCVWVFRIDATHAHEFIRIPFHCVRGVTIIPSVVDNLNKDGFFNVVCCHQFQQHLRGSVLCGWICCLRCPRKLWIVFPNVNMWVNNSHIL